MKVKLKKREYYKLTLSDADMENLCRSIYEYVPLNDQNRVLSKIYTYMIDNGLDTHDW